MYFPPLSLSSAGNVNIKQDCSGAEEAAVSQNLKGAAKLKGKNCISSSQVSCWESCDSDDSSSDGDAQGTEDCVRGRKSKKMQTDTEADVAYPEPRRPFPCTSSLTSHEQKTHVGYLISKKSRSPSQVQPSNPAFFFSEILVLLIVFLFVFSDLSEFQNAIK